MHIDRRTGRPFSAGTQEYDPLDRDTFTAPRPQRRSIRLLTELFVSLQLALTIRASIAWPPRLQNSSSSIAACDTVGRILPSATR